MNLKCLETTKVPLPSGVGVAYSETTQDRRSQALVSSLPAHWVALARQEASETPGSPKTHFSAASRRVDSAGSAGSAHKLSPNKRTHSEEAPRRPPLDKVLVDSDNLALEAWLNKPRRAWADFLEPKISRINQQEACLARPLQGSKLELPVLRLAKLKVSPCSEAEAPSGNRIPPPPTARTLLLEVPI